MRDPNRIKIITEKLEELWEKFPDLRLGQIIEFIGNERDIFNIEDDVWLEKIEYILDGVNGKE